MRIPAVLGGPGEGGGEEGGEEGGQPAEAACSKTGSHCQASPAHCRPPAAGLVFSDYHKPRPPAHGEGGLGEQERLEAPEKEEACSLAQPGGRLHADI